MDQMNEIGRAIAYLRGGTSQAEAARQAGIHRASWSLYEAGKRIPREQTIERIVKGLGCSRLELEETVWRIRRERLLYEERLRRRRGDASPAEEASDQASHRPAGTLPQDASPGRGDLVRREVQAMLAEISAVLEKFLTFILTDRS
jgi:transcriptional regulator with XRE-family HTH domain